MTGDGSRNNGYYRWSRRVLENVMSAVMSRSILPKKRSLWGTHEHFGEEFNDAGASAIIFQQPARWLSENDGRREDVIFRVRLLDQLRTTAIPIRQY